MKFDIVFVTYNSKKWLDGCIQSIIKSDYNLKNVSLLFYDNNSVDDTLTSLNKLKDKYEKLFDKIEIIKSNVNRGFGYGNNEAAKLGNAPYIFFLNIDTEINSDTLKQIESEINASEKDFGMWELAQAPYEHPKYYDPLTQETSWASGACMIVKRDVFEKIGGFDKRIFMYSEDVDLSWNFRRNGYKIKYLYNVKIKHFSYSEPGEFKYTQFVYSFISNWYLRSKYGKVRNFLRGAQYLIQASFTDKYLPKVIEKTMKKKIQKELRKELLIHFFRNLFISLKRKNSKIRFRFLNELDYEITKENPFYVQPEITTNPLVSIIVRTCNRKEALRENLISLRKQTYKNIEIIIVEDGKNTAEEMVKKEFKDLNIVYYATGKNQGRSNAANLAMEKATGKYLNFLDDDDLFYPDHVETLVKVLEKNNYEIVYGGAFETPIDVINKNPYEYIVRNKGLCESKPFNRFALYKTNLFPIQTVMFKKSLVNECGNFDVKLDALEDWDFWVRLSLKHEFYQVKHTTSIYRVPSSKQDINKRNEFLSEPLKYLENKFKEYKPNFTVCDFYKK